MQIAGAFANHSAKKKAAKARNRQRMMAYKEAQRQYTREVKLKNAGWKNQVQNYQIALDQNFQAMMEEHAQARMSIKEAYKQSGFEIQRNIIDSYRNQYAGEGTGVTASRLKGQALRSLGLQNAEVMSKLMLSKEKAQMGAEQSTAARNRKAFELWSQVWRSPVHGHTPKAPEQESGPSSAGLWLSVAQAGLNFAGAMGPGIGKAPKADPFASGDIFKTAAPYSGSSSDFLSGPNPLNTGSSRFLDIGPSSTNYWDPNQRIPGF